MSDSELSDEYEEVDSDAELQEAFAKGLLKPGLNVEVVKNERQYQNKVPELKRKLSDIQLKHDWIERLDLVNAPAPLAPELAFKLQEEELQNEAKLSKSKKKKKKPAVAAVSGDPVLNEFQRETLFHRQAQAAVLAGIPKLKALGVKTKRPDDYFAEMAKSDEHMQKVREHLMKKQHAQERSEKAKQQRHLRKVGKQVQVQAKLKQAKEKREMMEEVKKSAAKHDYKDKKFGFGGKKRGLKRNTKNSFNEISGSKRKGIGSGKQKHKRPGKDRRMRMKAKRKS
ncbi:putative rRNA-processing protein EBP2 [Blattella germanica]|nr:putative rRNA-processing protein EBP2 [Blattella germanica]